MQAGKFAAVAAAALMLSGARGLAMQEKPDTSGKTATAAVNLNTATAAQIEALPGIGPKTAARIVEYRQKNGPFKKIEELMNVRGVGEKSFLKLKHLIVVSPAKPERSSSPSAA